MTQAYRDTLRGLDQDSNHAAHAGLLLSRFLAESVPEKNDAEDASRNKGHVEARLRLFKATQAALKHSKPLYAEAFMRRFVWLQEIGARQCFLPVKDRLIVGLGGDNVLETGLTLHHTYGAPVIPGSALKGLAAHYCDQTWGKGPKGTEFRRKVPDGFKNGKVKYRCGTYHKTLFGQHDDAGHIQFFDAWIIPEALGAANTGLVDDVMTPHHGGYYSGRKEDGPLPPPADFDSPNPIRFLSVAGTFHLALACDGNEHGPALEWAELAARLLLDALADWGVGGKTNAGYGRFVLPEDTRSRTAPQSSLERYRREARSFRDTLDRAERKARADAQFNRTLDMLSPFGREFASTAHEGRWDTDKTAFTSGTVIERWVERLEHQFDSQVYDRLVALIDKHLPGLLADPNKISGKRQRPAFSDRQRMIANRLIELAVGQGLQPGGKY